MKMKKGVKDGFICIVVKGEDFWEQEALKRLYHKDTELFTQFGLLVEREGELYRFYKNIEDLKDMCVVEKIVKDAAKFLKKEVVGNDF